MNAVFELEVNRYTKASQRSRLSNISGQIVPLNSPAVAEAISILLWSWQGNSMLIFTISKVIRIKQIAA